MESTHQTSAPPTYLPPREAADLLRLRPQTLRAWRVRGTGPFFIRLGSRILYRYADVEAWLAERPFSHTTAADHSA